MTACAAARVPGNFASISLGATASGVVSASRSTMRAPRRVSGVREEIRVSRRAIRLRAFLPPHVERVEAEILVGEILRRGEQGGADVSAWERRRP